MSKANIDYLCDKYALPDKLIPDFVQKIHADPELSLRHKEALEWIKRAQIKWCYRNGWIPPENNVN